MIANAYRTRLTLSAAQRTLSALAVCGLSLGCTFEAEGDASDEDVASAEEAVSSIANKWWVNRKPATFEWLALYLFNDGSKKRVIIEYMDPPHMDESGDGQLRHREGEWETRNIDGQRQFILDGDKHKYRFKLEGNEVRFTRVYDVDLHYGVAPPSMEVRQQPCQTETLECVFSECDNRCQNPNLHLPKNWSNPD